MNFDFREKTKFRKRGIIKCKVGFANVGSATLGSNHKPNGVNFFTEELAQIVIQLIGIGM